MSVHAIEPLEAGLPAARTLLVMRRRGISSNSEEPDLAYYITNVPALPKNTTRFNDLVRGHWGASEIKNHWVRDAQFGEDKTRSKNRNINANLAILRVALLAIKAYLLPDATWPQIIETAQANSAFAYQLVVNHRLSDAVSATVLL